jgi:hypothetical protein
MSGVEVLSIVAAVLGIADLGGRVSVKIYTFGQRVYGANRSLTDISNDVALTCNVLRELGDNLKRDEKSRLCSTSAVSTTEEIITDCSKVFKELEDALDKTVRSCGPDISSKDRFLKLAGKFKWPFLEPKMELLRSNLDRLKSTLLLM